MALSELVQQGLAALQAGNRDEAIKLFTQALREDRQDEEAWLYLGLVLTDVNRKRQAFEQVLKINPANERAQQGLAKLGAASNARRTTPEAGESAGTAKANTPDLTGQRIADARKRASVAVDNVLRQDIKIPGQIAGKPEAMKIGDMISRAQWLFTRTSKLYVGSNTDALLTQLTEVTTPWDVTFMTGAAAVAFGVLELIGRFLMQILFVFRGFFDLGRLIFSPVFGGLIALASAAAAIIGGVFVCQIYFESLNEKGFDFNRHLKTFIQVIYPAIIAEGIIRLIIFVLIGLTLGNVSPLSTLLSIALAAYAFVLLRKPYEQMYGTINNRGTIAAAITVGTYWVILHGLLWLIGSIFRI